MKEWMFFLISSHFFLRKISFTSLSHGVYNIQCFVDIFYLHSQLNFHSFLEFFLCLGEIWSVYRSARVTPTMQAAFKFRFLTVFLAPILMLCSVFYRAGEIMSEWETLILWWKLKGNSCTEFNIYDLSSRLPSFAFIVFIMIVNVYHLGKRSFLPLRLGFSSRQAKGFSDILSFIYFALSVDNYTHRDGKLLLLNAHI